jgi:hypothetical protein
LRLRKNNNFNNILSAKVITSIGFKVIRNLCLHQLFIVYTYQNTESDKNYASLVVSIKLGKKMFSHYIISLKDNYIKENGQNITYSLFLEKWKGENPDLAV